MKISLLIRVIDVDNKKIMDAEVVVHDEKKQTLRLEANKKIGLYVAEEISPGTVEIKVSYKDLASETRTVTLNTGENEEVFILGRKGMPFYYRGRVKVPFEPLPHYIAVVVKEDDVQKYKERLHEITKGYKLEMVKVGENIRKNGCFIYQVRGEKEYQAAQESLKNLEFVLFCGPILKLFEQNVTLLTDSIIVRFKGHVTKEQAVKISRKYGLIFQRTIPYAGNGYQYLVKGPLSYKILDICEQLVDSGLVEYAEPDLWHTVEDDAITPTDWLFPEQWDHPIINTPDAWQALADIDVNKTFGDPTVHIAIVDSGVNAAHPAFSGNVTNGNPKVYQLFDFANMVANNNSLAGDHGTACAGGATGKANDASAVMGVNEGTAGLAGNARLIGIRRSGPESRYADVYIWAGGFNPNSAIVGFPVQINPGADIISNSFGYSVNNPISGLMKDTFDFLTTYGRNGKGVLLFFSAGNDNVNLDATFRRPWGMYKKCLQIAASTLDNTGLNEIKTSYSNVGTTIQFSAPSNDNSGPHNPPTSYGAFTTGILNQGNLPGRPTVQNTLSGNANAGVNMITLNNVAGFAVGQAVLIGNPGDAGTEAKIITAVNVMTNQLTLSANLLSNHLNGATVAASTPDYLNNFGGTSYATPVCAGLAALVLSANKNLTWIEVREIIKNTAVKIDPNNNDPVGRWQDINGLVATDVGYIGPFFSQWYGYGRINVAAAVEEAADYTFDRDIHVRDNLADTGFVPSVGTFWQGFDIWVRNVNDGVAPVNYAAHANTVHQSPIFGQNNWVYVRFKNIGDLASFPFFVRVYLTHWAGTEFIYPTDFIPSVRPNDPLPVPLTPGTYLIGEAQVNSLAALTEGNITVQWNANLVPPETVMVSGMEVHWHPCLLVEITPQDGFTPTGSHVWENNNLAQKNLSITYPDNSDGFSIAAVVGNLKNRSKFLVCELKIKWPVPRSEMYVSFLNPYVERYLMSEIKNGRQKDLKTGKLREKTVFFITSEKVKIKLPNSGLLPVIVGGKAGKLSKKEIGYIEVQQFNDNGKSTGGLSFEVRGK